MDIEPDHPEGKDNEMLPRPGRLGRFCAALTSALTSPTGKQMEAYARFLHTLSAASFIGAITVTGAEGGTLRKSQAIGLFVIGAVLFLLGAPMAKGESKC